MACHFRTRDYFRDCRKSPNVMIVENLDVIKSTTCVSEKTRFKVFRQSLLKSCFSIFTLNATFLMEINKSLSRIDTIWLRLTEKEINFHNFNHFSCAYFSVLILYWHGHRILFRLGTTGSWDPPRQVGHHPPSMRSLVISSRRVQLILPTPYRSGQGGWIFCVKEF